MATEPTQVGPQNVQATLNNLGQNRKMVFAGATFITIIIALVIIVFVWSRGASQGGEINLVKGIDQGRAFEIVSKLERSNIESKILDSELPGKVNIAVFEKQFDKAALLLARSDLLQEDGFNLFDKSDWASSDYDKRIKMVRAINGDLSRIVSRLQGVKWATVRINIPEQQLFSQYQAPTTATVQVELPEDLSKLSSNHVKSIINLLVGYVPNLQKGAISIIDTNGHTYSSVETEEVVASDALEETEKVNKTIQDRIEDYLEPIIGANNFIVRVSSEISRKKIEESATTFAEGVVGQEQVGGEVLGGSASGGQIAAGPTLPGTGEKSYSRTNKVIQRYPSYKQKTISTPPGTIVSVSVAVAINGGLPPTVSLKQLKEGIAAITSPSTTADDVKITLAEFAKPLAAQKTRSTKTPISTGGDFVGQTSNFLKDSTDKALGFFKRMPLWVNITIAVMGLIIVLNSMGRMFARPPVSPQQSTISQINSRVRGGEATAAPIAGQIAANEQQPFQEERPTQQIASEEKTDLAGVLSGLQEAATEQPQALANKLEIWLEEGSPAGRA